ncbi:HalOD1 output domain-containing protein [Halobaculum litoreum]|uniref:HalOD1 output domain-containing protein n=1 Tax=Halobaculum litoreum TaxID=3031998 RepID=A0ABD5XL00_9EURY
MEDPHRSAPDDGEPTESPIAHRTYDWSVTDPVTAVVESLSSATGVAPGGVDPLQHAVDCDALDRLVRSGDGTHVAVSFTHGGHVVSVTGGGGVSLRPV